jgi:hypothetical protein
VAEESHVRRAVLLPAGVLLARLGEPGDVAARPGEIAHAPRGPALAVRAALGDLAHEGLAHVAHRGRRGEELVGVDRFVGAPDGRQIREPILGRLGAARGALGHLLGDANDDLVEARAGAAEERHGDAIEQHCPKG